MKSILVVLLIAGVGLAAEEDWYKTANFYQIYPRSFKDSNNDGVGDLEGIISKLDYLKELGVTATWLSPILKSPQADFGYDIADFKNVDPLFGTNAQLERKFSEAKKLGIKIIMDFVPNHTSDEHEWFKISLNTSHPEHAKYRDYYVWHNGTTNPEGGTPLPPNNWQAVFGTIAWTWRPERSQYYLHQFHPKQPDLNYRNPDVVQEMKDVLTYWMEKGADGFRIDAINHLFEVEDFRDEPLTNWTSDPTNYGYTHHYYTKDLDEMYDMVRQWRELIDKYNKDHPGSTRVIFTEAYANLTFTMRYYGNASHPISHFPFNFLMIEKLDESKKASDFKREIDEWINNIPAGATSNWVLGNHDKPRVGSRYGVDRVDGMLMLLLLLPGVAVTYNGDEIGMLDYRDGITFEQTRDPQGCNAGRDNFKWASRDPERTPFQWDNSTFAGFCEQCNATWLPVHSNYKDLNLAKQRAEEKSFFKFYKQLSELRNDEIFKNGIFVSKAYNDDVFAFKRTYNNESYVVLINFGNETHTIDVSQLNVDFEGRSQVVLAGSRTSYNVGDFGSTTGFILNKYDSVVLKSKASTLIASFVVFLSAFLLKLLFN